MLSPLFRRLHNFLLCAEHLGIATAVKIMLVRPWYGGAMQIRLPTGRAFHFRGKHDGAVVLSHFCFENYYIDDSQLPVRSIIDGGAFIGDETVRFLEYYPHARVVAVEAAKENFEVLSRNCGSDARAHLVFGAIYPERAHIVMERQSSLESFKAKVTQGATAETVATWDIPSLIEMLPTPSIDILKLDIEGAEYELFSTNTSAWIGKVRAIIFEVDYHRPELTQRVLRSLDQFEFNVYLSGENLVLMRKDVPWILRRVQGFPMGSARGHRVGAEKGEVEASQT
jgi:FkbM family methyltransferase